MFIGSIVLLLVYQKLEGTLIALLILFCLLFLSGNLLNPLEWTWVEGHGLEVGWIGLGKVYISLQSNWVGL